LIVVDKTSKGFDIEINALTESEGLESFFLSPFDNLFLEASPWYLRI
jgi:hypothetical protein